jgi:hypothetical protein
MSAVAAASASAETPEFRFAGSSRGFSSRAGSSTLETTAGEALTCENETAAGEAEGTTKIRNIVISKKGCRVTVLGQTYKCKSAGAGEEETVTFDLLARLGWINKAEKQVGVSISPEEGKSNNPNNLFEEFECTHGSSKIEAKARGATIGLVGPLNTLINPGKAFTGKSEISASKGVPLYTKFEGEAEDKLEVESSLSKKFIGAAIRVSAEGFFLVSTEIAT